jgi:flagellar FliJ protein
MAGFTFQYETVLEQRRRVERQRQRELAEAQQAQQRMKDQLRQMQQTVDQSKQQIREQLIGSVDLTQIGSVARYSAQVTFRGQQLVQQLATQDKEVQQARAQLAEATRQRKILEQLKERHYQQWLWQQRRNERRQQDELATKTFMQQHLQGGRP